MFPLTLALPPAFAEAASRRQAPGERGSSDHFLSKKTWFTDTDHRHACVPKHFSAQARSRHFLMSRTAFEKEKELTDRALKLAEAGKSKSNWELQGLLGLAAVVLGLLVGK
jgi:hypothetical protein